jgi:hypothetical protein
MSTSKCSINPLMKGMPSHEDLLINLEADNSPHARNLEIWDYIIKEFKDKYYAGNLMDPNSMQPVMERDMKVCTAAFTMMKKECFKHSGEMSGGIAVIDFMFVNNKVVSVLILFHDGKVNNVN